MYIPQKSKGLPPTVVSNFRPFTTVHSVIQFQLKLICDIHVEYYFLHKGQKVVVGETAVRGRNLDKRRVIEL